MHQQQRKRSRRLFKVAILVTLLLCVLGLLGWEVFAAHSVFTLMVEPLYHSMFPDE